MTPRQAAKYIGCALSTVRAMLKDGRLKAKKVPMDYGNGPQGFHYDITTASIERVKHSTQSTGYPRGRKRT